MGMGNSIIIGEAKENPSPITWNISPKIRDDNGYDVKVEYTIFKYTSKGMSEVAKKGEAFFHFSEPQLELESRLMDFHNKARGRFGLPPDCGELSDEKNEKANALRAKLKRKVTTEGFSVECLEKFFLESKELREQVVKETLYRWLYNTKDDFITIKRGEEKISGYVNCVL